jgi:ABC-2 type transport system ATP-binding protein
MSIKVQNITKKYGKQLALNSVSFETRKDEILGLLGPNGAGKSTLMKILTGYIVPDSGRAYICDEKIEPEKIHFRKKTGYLPEHNPLYPEMYIREYLYLVAGFYKLKNKKESVNHVIEMTGLYPEISKKIGALSKGYRQRVGLAQALIHNPEVLILDEPTSGLDPNQLDEIRNLIIEISKQKTVMLSTHIMQEVEAICKRVVIINQGSIIADGPTAQLSKMSVDTGQKVIFELSDPIESSVLEKLPYVANITRIENNKFLITTTGTNDIRPKLFRFAVDNKYTIISMHEQTQSVEKIFRELTQ